MIRLVMALMASVFLFTACSKDENDKLEGKWQLRTVETEGQSIVVDTVFYNFQTSLFMYQIYNSATDGMSRCYGYKELIGQSELQLELVPDVDPDFLKYTDWNDLTETFAIEKLTGSQLILSRDNKRYTFRKF